MSESLLRKQLARVKGENAALERLIEDRSRALRDARVRLKRSTRFLSDILGAIRSLVIVADREGRIVEANQAAERLFADVETDATLVGRALADVLEIDGLGSDWSVDALLRTDRDEAALNSLGGSAVPIWFAASSLSEADTDSDGVVCVGHDLSERKQLEVELRHAQKLESVGQLAAGVAHEINTPVQFTGDSIEFLQEAFTDLRGVIAAYRQLCDAIPDDLPGVDSLRQGVLDAESDADIEFLEEEIPAAIDRAVDGVGRVASIVRAMRSFSHPGDSERAPRNLNDALRTTLEVSRNEYKYVAKLEEDYGEVPEVLCDVGDLNQVFLNLIVNAAHAIEEKYGKRGGLGVLSVATKVEGDRVTVAIGDDGNGIPEDVRGRILDPFFTTKEVGKGTGQGLAISRNVVVEQHGGQLRFETRSGVGTTFYVSLPIGSRDG